ncbi:MAG: hypothetical protein ACREPY_12510 [Rhodanobacteraceae bacterium]
MNRPSSLDRLQSAAAKLARAREHVDAITACVREYLNSTPYVISTTRESDTNRLTYFVASVKPTPTRVSALIGDAIHNLRSALDHVAYQLVWVAVGTPPSTRVYFPIGDNRERYLEQRRHQLKGALSDAIAAVDAVKPYHGGNDLLWQLHKLNNIDKHRMLLTAGSVYQSFNIGPRMSRDLRNLMADVHDGSSETDFPSVNLFLQPKNKKFPLEAGDRLLTDLPDAEPDPTLQFQFSLSFGEQGIVYGEPIIETMAAMLKCVEELLSTFKSHLQ